MSFSSLEFAKIVSAVLLGTMTPDKACLVAKVKGSGMGCIVGHDVTEPTFKPKEAQKGLTHG